MMDRMPADPFSDIGRQDEKVYEQIVSQRKAKLRAEKSYQKLLKKYGDLLQDERYKEILSVSELVLKEQLNLLIATACKCRDNCAPIAERVRLIREMVRMPIETVWYESRREEMEFSNGESQNGNY